MKSILDHMLTESQIIGLIEQTVKEPTYRVIQDFKKYRYLAAKRYWYLICLEQLHVPLLEINDLTICCGEE